jgi:hypothetical protein
MRLIFLLLLISVVASGQGSFKNLRFDERYDYLADSSNRGWYDNMKFSKLNKKGVGYASIGGEIRFQYFRFTNEAWGDAPQDDDGFVLSRFLLHGDVHFTKRMRLFFQVQSSLADGRIDPSPVEQNELDLHQAFMDMSLFQNEYASLVLRVGRQELSYGSSRLISTREGPNNRQAFDGAKIIFDRRNVHMDLFYTDYVVSKQGIFNDDFFGKNVKLWGGYLVKNNAPLVGNIDLYYIGIRRDQATWSDVQGIEQRHSIGSRIWRAGKRFSYDIEGLYQFGTLDVSTISAWTLSFNNSYVLGNRKSSPTVGLKTELISGDAETDDQRVQSFNPLFPRGAYFGYAALIGPSNLFDIHPSLSIPVSNVINFSTDYDILWRYSTQDGIYSPGAKVIYGPGDSGKAFIGHQVSGNIDYTPNKHIFIRAEVTWFKTGTYLKSVSSGKNILFIGFTSTLRF